MSILTWVANWLTAPAHNGPYWTVPVDTWPTFDIDHDQLVAMLDEFDHYWPAAVASLAEAAAPTTSETP